MSYIKGQVNLVKIIILRASLCVAFKFLLPGRPTAPNVTACPSTTSQFVVQAPAFGTGLAPKVCGRVVNTHLPKPVVAPALGSHLAIGGGGFFWHWLLSESLEGIVNLTVEAIEAASEATSAAEGATEASKEAQEAAEGANYSAYLAHQAAKAEGYVAEEALEAARYAEKAANEAASVAEQAEYTAGEATSAAHGAAEAAMGAGFAAEQAASAAAEAASAAEEASAGGLF